VKRTALISLILGTALVFASAANAVVWSDGDSSSGPSVATITTDPATQAVLLRSEGLANYYELSPATQAVVLRSQELGDYYAAQKISSVPIRDGWMSSVTPQSSGIVFHTDVLGGDGGTPVTNTPIATGDDSFAWNLTAIGAAGLAGAMLLALGTLAVTRRKHILSF
jgi:hypothetical protein